MSTTFFEYTATMPADLTGGEAEMLIAFLRRHRLLKPEEQSNELRFAVQDSDSCPGSSYTLTDVGRARSVFDEFDRQRCREEGIKVSDDPVYADDDEEVIILTLLRRLISEGKIILVLEDKWRTNACAYPDD